jgi:hypothetical protein
MFELSTSPNLSIGQAPCVLLALVEEIWDLPRSTTLLPASRCLEKRSGMSKSLLPFSQGWEKGSGDEG